MTCEVGLCRLCSEGKTPAGGAPGSSYPDFCSSPVRFSTALKQIAILGSTGSIGQSTLSIIESYPERFAVASLAAGRNVDSALEQCRRWKPSLVSMASEELAGELRSRLKAAGISGTEVVWGRAGTVAVATLPTVDFVVSAIVGVAGLEATYAAVQAGKAVGLANKEAMVAAGEILTREARAAQCAVAPYRLRAQCHSPVHAGWEAGRGAADLADGFGRAIPDAAAGEVFGDHRRASFEASDMEHGTADHDRFRDDAE